MATATKAPKAAAAEEATSTVETIRENVSERATAAKEAVAERYETVRDTASTAASVAKDFGTAYYNGVSTLGKTLFGFAQEFYAETAEHATKTMKAKNLTSVAELQAAFIQSRIENSATHGKVFIDVARQQTEATMKPVIALLNTKSAA
ncbi:MAG: phasin family protein [Pseudomonadota bacterium]